MMPRFIRSARSYAVADCNIKVSTRARCMHHTERQATVLVTYGRGDSLDALRLCAECAVLVLEEEMDAATWRRVDPCHYMSMADALELAAATVTDAAVGDERILNRKWRNIVAWITEQGRWVGAAEIAQRYGYRNTNSVLVTLMHLWQDGVLERQMQGKRVVYRAKQEG